MMIDFTLVPGFVKGKNSVVLGALFCVMNTFAMSLPPKSTSRVTSKRPGRRNLR